MILFDTNELRSFSTFGSVAAMLKAVAEDAGQVLAISSVTEDEYRFARKFFYETPISEAERALKNLKRLNPRWRPPHLDYPSVSSLVEADIERIRAMFTVIPLGGEDAVESLRREAARQP